VAYHPGDCAPYPDLPSHLRRYHLYLLPVNACGARRAKGGPGNLIVEEALSLAAACGVEMVIGHHFGMFDFNTIDLAAARTRVVEEGEIARFFLAEWDLRYDLLLHVGRGVREPGTRP